jgi:glycosyltransferase involved in cell wall biosynthesis
LDEKPPRSPLAISVFYPCYNEEANVENTTLAALRTLERISSDFEVIIVNDGSKDRTAEIADRLAEEHAHVRAVHNNPNLGYGGALQRGFRESTKPWVFYTDGDGQFDFEELDKILPLLDRYDIISGFRLDRQDSLIRKLNAFAWTTLVNFVFGLWLSDIDCAYKMFPRKLFDEIEMKSMGALIDAEILARAKRLGYKIGQVGVHHYARTAGEQSGANLKVILRAFKELFALRRDIRSTKPKRTS